MTEAEIVRRKREREPADRPALVDPELADELLARAQTDGVELLGPDGCQFRRTHRGNIGVA
jgi:hypothetical protein